MEGGQGVEGVPGWWAGRLEFQDGVGGCRWSPVDIRSAAACLQTAKPGDWPHLISAFFKVCPHFISISENPVGRGSVTKPVNSCHGSRSVGMRDGVQRKLAAHPKSIQVKNYSPNT